jgi:hypothetical protein
MAMTWSRTLSTNYQANAKSPSDSAVMSGSEVAGALTPDMRHNGYHDVSM